MQVFRGADVGRGHFREGAHGLKALGQTGQGVLLCVRFLRFVLEVLRGDFGDLFLVLAHLQIHLDLPVGEPAVLRRIVFVVGDLFHQRDGAALVEILLDAGLVDGLLELASGEDESENNDDGRGTAHEGLSVSVTD